MSSLTTSKTSDITFVGSGISCSYTIIHLLDKIEKSPLKNKLTITVIDKYPEFGTGIPYGSRSGNSVLLITSLKDFLPEPERSRYIDWLNNNKEWLLEKFKSEGGSLSQKWIDKHATQIEINDWEEIFIPRSFFGIYTKERIKNKIEELNKEGYLDFNYLNSNVIDVHKKDNNQYDVILENGDTINSKNVILSIGSLPINYLWGSKSLIEKDQLLFVNNAYKPNLNEVLKNISNYSNKFSNKINVVIVGTNASGLELLYKLNDVEEIEKKIDKFTFLSTQGLIPNAIVDEEGRNKFIAKNLDSLQEKEILTAKEIADAAFKDLDYAEEIELGAASTVGKISSAFGSLLNKLNEKELRKFACNYGNEIGRRQRCAGDHYLKTIDKLKKENRFNHIAGRFNDVIKSNSSEEYLLEYLETKSKTVKTLEEPTHIVINCAGSMSFNNENLPSLVRNIIEKKYCIPNESKIGFDVNDNLETMTNFHIVGPLLAGNIIEEKPVWHVEHCGRIIWLSEVLAKKIYKKIIFR
ncbi:FAD/NAD(P)-binding protein [Urechidicola croceus]|uniref:FAD-dependent urate hydroxylase HpyO/Asp monooxygenase CreE-like FAD/NAD(P)-binding domain-containing protein n=1 Tax=Urechidicola croceus TaxID=1850246 RepID=A0A1D8P697_9FLAO|nr:FAD/NAD(P)-binding protein [Urechidicola croceus]AOW20098.1 hypothetical protein LPB138_05120 [Urechidicola croceus]